MPNFFWWVWHIILSFVSAFFLLFGIQLLVSAYRLNNPHFFIMTFFSSNLIILISGALLFGLICRMIVSKKKIPEDKE